MSVETFNEYDGLQEDDLHRAQTFNSMFIITTQFNDQPDSAPLPESSPIPDSEPVPAPVEEPPHVKPDRQKTANSHIVMSGAMQ